MMRSAGGGSLEMRRLKQPRRRNRANKVTAAEEGAVVAAEGLASRRSRRWRTTLSRSWRRSRGLHALFSPCWSCAPANPRVRSIVTFNDKKVLEFLRY